MNPKRKFTTNKKDRPTDKRWGGPITWTIRTQHVDMDTGELLTQQQIKTHNYVKITMAKDYQISQELPIGTGTYTYLYRRGPQLNLW